MVKISDLPSFDAADYLDSEEAITAYLNTILEENDGALLTEALGDIAKTKDMTQITRDADIVCNDRNTIKQRITESEAGKHLTDEEYERRMNEFYAKELGLTR